MTTKRFVDVEADAPARDGVKSALASLPTPADCVDPDTHPWYIVWLEEPRWECMMCPGLKMLRRFTERLGEALDAPRAPRIVP